MTDVNLKAMHTIAHEFCVNYGYSDHSLGIEVPIAAVALGATVIEKHFTLDKEMNGPDHRSSLSPNQLKHMVRSVRNIEQALGDGIKKPSPSETKNINIARRSLVASVDILKGQQFTVDNVTAKRPGSGISPMLFDSIIGRFSRYDIKKDELIVL